MIHFHIWTKNLNAFWAVKESSRDQKHTCIYQKCTRKELNVYLHMNEYVASKYNYQELFAQYSNFHTTKDEMNTIQPFVNYN